MKLKLKPPPVRLLPPPPPRRHLGGSPIDGLTGSQLNTVPTTKGNEEEENSETDVPKKGVKVKSRPYYLRRSKRLNFLKTNINSLPDEIVFDILVHLPAQDVFGAVMSVCLKWYQMIHTHKFVNIHLHRSTYGSRGSLTTQLTSMGKSRQGRIELTRLNYEPRYELWCNSCNGLILESERENHQALYITNPATMQHFALPPFFGSPTAFLRSAIAYASLSMEYKVVRVHLEEDQWCCAILTAGVDESWRRVRTQHLSLQAKELFTFKPLTTEGFVHWASGNYVLTLNVETEIIVEYFVPSSCSGDRFSDCYYFLTVKHLSLLIQFGGCSWEVWEMKPETGEWTKLPGIELTKDRKCEIVGLLSERGRISKPVGYNNIPLVLQSVGWLEYKEILVYLVCSPALCEKFKVCICIAWNIRLNKIEYIELDSIRDIFLVHRNSLLWLDGCY